MMGTAYRLFPYDQQSKISSDKDCNFSISIFWVIVVYKLSNVKIQKVPIIICESWLSLFQLSGLAEVFLQDEKRNEFFSFLVEELADVFVGVAGYFDGFVGAV